MKTVKKQSAEAAAAGVDRGGTWTRLSCVDSRGRELRGARFPTTELGRLALRLEKEFKKLELETNLPLIIATRGAFSRKWKRDFLFKTARGRFNLVDVISDAEAAHFAAFGGKEGLLLIAGTGSVTFYKSSAGELIRTGGYNPADGDPGSGRWLGRKYLKKLNKPVTGLGRGQRQRPATGQCLSRGQRHRPATGQCLSHGQTAAYAKVLLVSAEKKEGWQRKLVEQAQNSLAALIAKSLKKTPRTNKIKVALAGGLTKNKFFRKGLIKRLREISAAKLVFTAPRVTAQTAAARMALAAYKKGK
ncbi:MAG: hypothetical protein A2X33_00230 [Elusimicrobia bacterium GWA2_51_34]|nr:MAG: hypothetical protein A2X33_00230 [Elusimicrobia bacterium GWA2_51_34]